MSIRALYAHRPDTGSTSSREILTCGHASLTNWWTFAYTSCTVISPLGLFGVYVRSNCVTTMIRRLPSSIPAYKKIVKSYWWEIFKVKLASKQCMKDLGFDDWKAVPTPWVYLVPITHVSTSEAMVIEFSVEILYTEQHLCLDFRWWLGPVHDIFSLSWLIQQVSHFNPY